MPAGLGDASTPTFETQPRIEWAKIGPGGRVVIPAAMRRALGIAVGDPVQLHVDGDELRVIPANVVYGRVRDIVAKYVPPEVSLVDELIDDRKREFEAEERGE